MPNKTGFIGKEKPIKNSQFEAKWGEPAWSIAKRENVTTATIHMRVHNYGSPYQRRHSPTKPERLTGKTMYQLAEELNLHPITVQQRLFKHDNPYVSMQGIDKPFPTHQKWRKGRYDIWLMPEHPYHAEWVADRKIDDAKLKKAKGVKYAK